MNTREIAKFVCQLLALYFTATILFSAPYLFSSLFYVDEGLGPSRLALFTATLAVFLGQFFVALALWLGAGRFSRWIVPEPSTIDLGGLSLEVLQRLAFSVVGLVFALQGGAALLEQSILSLNASFGLGLSWREVVGPGVRLLLGGFLLLGAKGLTGFLSGLESNRISREEIESEEGQSSVEEKS